MAQELISSYCTGGKNDFIHVCESLLPPSTCHLLKNYELRIIFDKGRCTPYELLKTTVKGILYRYRDVFSRDQLHPEDYVESVTFELADDLRARKLTKHHNLPALKKYFNITVVNAVLDILDKEQLLPRKTCGGCIHLSRSKPFCCQLQQVALQNKHGESKTAHLFYNTERVPSSKACKDGFEGYTFESDVSTPLVAPASSDAPMLDSVLKNMFALLDERTEQAQTKKEKQVRRRQLAILTELRNLIFQGYSRQEAFDEITQILGINRKMLYRDLKEIENFLIEKCPGIAKNSPFRK